MDYVRCSNCEFMGLVSQEERQCPNCSRKGTLQWTFSDCCSSEIVFNDGTKYCSKCETQVS